MCPLHKSFIKKRSVMISDYVFPSSKLELPADTIKFGNHKSWQITHSPPLITLHGLQRSKLTTTLMSPKMHVRVPIVTHTGLWLKSLIPNWTFFINQKKNVNSFSLNFWNNFTVVTAVVLIVVGTNGAGVVPQRESDMCLSIRQPSTKFMLPSS